MLFVKDRLLAQPSEHFSGVFECARVPLSSKSYSKTMEHVYRKYLIYETQPSVHLLSGNVTPHKHCTSTHVLIHVCVVMVMHIKDYTGVGTEKSSFIFAKPL